MIEIREWEPSALAGPLTVRMLDAPESLRTLEAEWNALVEQTRDEPFFRNEYIRSWIENFAPDARLRLLTARNAQGRLVGLLPLIEERARYCGVPLRQWSSPTNVHSYRYDLLARDKAAVSRAFFSFLRETGGWDAILLTDICDGGNAWGLHALATEARFPVGVYESNRSVYISLPSTVESLEAALSGKFRGNLRRRRALLDKKGTVSVERYQGGPDLQARIEECFDIEARGWKGVRGQAANHDPKIHGFYSALARRTSADGSFSLFVLKLNGRPIAFHYGLTRNGVYSLIMTSFDESLRDCSPGHLLVEEVLKACIDAGWREFDFLGCDLEWKRAWSNTSRQHSWLYIFRPTLRGRLASQLKFRVTPAVKQLWARWKSSTPGVNGGARQNGG